MKLAIIVVSWNTSELLAACLKSVYAYPPQCDFEMWVVDNASKDDSVAMVQQHFPQVRLIVNEANVGFAQANNQAICDSDSEYVLLLNPDTEVKPGAIQHLIDFIEAHPKVGATGSRLLNPDGSLQISCHPMPTLAREFWRMFYMDDFFPYGRYPMRRWDMETPRDVDVIQGASFLLRRTVLNTVGFLDDTYFMYSEEVDLCFRLQKAGWRLYWVPQSQVTHYGGQSTRQVAQKMFIELYRGKVIFFRKHYGALAANLYKSILFLAALPRIVFAPLFLPLQSKPKREALQRLAQFYRRLVVELPRL